MTKKHCSKACSDPSSKNYSEEENNKAHSKSPSGETEPSTGTHYK